ncbi:MAG: hypothetical protein KGL31_07165 [candidate division NC10 bacterium]|nr:hypothetical protein [candidate division NC10 bacterium]MDE2321681.1 hypothetical protein [candidate division NC10 bacterium]
MRMTCHERLFRSRCTYTTLAAFLTWSMAAVVPPTARAVEPPLGTATGSKEAQITTDGKQWITLSASSNPLYEGGMIRTAKGTASILLKDGTQLELQSQTVVGLSGSRTAPVVKIAVGQVLFRLPSSSRGAFVTPTVRYQAEGGNMGNRPDVLQAKVSTLSVADPVGEITVNPQGGSRIGLQQGEMFAKSVNDPGLHIVKAGQSVYIPHIGPSDPSFGVLLAQVLPGEPSGMPVGGIPVYTVDGKSIGYITADGSFSSSPGFTPNLPNRVPADTIPQDATIPPGATPIFTATPEYAGYILDDKLFAYAPPIGDGMAGVGGGAGAGMGTGAAIGLGVTAAAIGVGVGLGVSHSGKASPSAP